MKINWNEIIHWLQVALTAFAIFIIVACISVLILFDVLAGTGVNLYLTRDNMSVSIIISMATTGLLLALMFMGYQAQKQEKFKAAGWVLLGVSAIVYLIDTYFDSLGADVLRYGTIVSVSGLGEIDRNIHILYRFLIGGISTVGEPLATAIIIGMPVLAEIIEQAMPGVKKYNQPRVYQQSATTPTMNKVQSQIPNNYQQRPAPRQTPPPMPTYYSAYPEDETG